MESPRDEQRNGGHTGSLRDWLIDGIASELDTAKIAIPAFVVAGLIALVVGVSFTVVLVTGVVLGLLVRVAAGGWLRLRSTDPAQPKSARDDL